MPNPRTRAAKNRALDVTVAAAMALGAAPSGASAGDSPVRLVQGPQVYRIKQAPANSDAPDYRYAIVARFSRVVIAPTFEGEGQSAGDFSIAGVPTEDGTHGTLPIARRTTECLTAYVFGFEAKARDLRKLGRIHLGAKTRVKLRPLLEGVPDVRYGRATVRHPVMRAASSWNFKSAADQRQLRRIGCNA